MSALDLTVLGIGAIIGTGIFVLTGVAAARYAGPAVVLSFVFAGIAATLAALVYAELASMVPVAGSAYSYTYAAMGRLVAWIIGWDLILEYTVAAGAVSIGWSSYLRDLLASAGWHLPHALTSSPFSGGFVNLPGLLIVAALTGVLVAGTRESAVINRIIVAVKLAVIALFIAVAIPRVNPAHWHPFNPFGGLSVVRGAAIIFFAYIGFDAVSTAAEEVRKPSRDLPRGILGSLLISTLLYLAVSGLLVGLVNYRRLDTASPVATALLDVGVRWGAAVISVGALAGLTSVLLAQIYGQSRVFFAMARDGLLPPFFARVGRRHTPYHITLLTGAAVAAIAGFLPIGLVAEMANIGTLAAFILVSGGVILLRYRRPDLPRPFRVPFMPWLPLLSIAFSLFLMANLPVFTLWRFAIWLAIGLAIYGVYGRHHAVPAEQTAACAAMRRQDEARAR